MSVLWRKYKSNSLTNYGNPSPTDQDIETSFAQNLEKSAYCSIEETSLAAFLSQRLYAGMTVEAAVVLPIFLFFLMNLSCAIEMIRLHGNLQMALWETGHKLAVYGYVMGEEDVLEPMEAEEEDLWWKELAGIGFSYTFIKNQLLDYLGEDYLNTSPISQGTAGLHFWESEILPCGDEIDIVVTYGVSPWCGLAGFASFRMANRYYAHIWNGYDITQGGEGGKEEGTTVYVAETGKVYHRDRSCTHLQLSIQEIVAENVDTYRNENGGRYSECLKCKGETVPRFLYITREGDCFHYYRSCSGLKRTIFAILLKDAGDYRPCGRCGGE